MYLTETPQRRNGFHLNKTLWLIASPAYSAMVLRKRRKCLIALIAAAVMLAAIISCVNLYVIGTTKGRIFSHLNAVPQREVGVVMGTDFLRSGGSTNLHFLSRTALAADLYLSHKVSRLLISGNKNNRGYNEVLGIQSVLMQKGVPGSAMVLDFEGNRTWDTVRRARDIYHLRTITVVTDGFHAPRSVFLCQHYGLDALAYCGGPEPFDYWQMRTYAREYLACMKAALDVWF